MHQPTAGISRQFVMQILHNLLVLTVVSCCGQAEAAVIRSQLRSFLRTAPNLNVCSEGHGRWRSPVGEDGKGKFDLVISYWSNSMKPVSFLEDSSEVHLNVAGQSEIKYVLRSYEKNGLLDYVRNVVLLMDAQVVRKIGLPTFFDYSSKPIRIVTDEDMGLDNTGNGNGKWSKRLTMHKIPGISDYFLYSPDDAFLVSKFDPNQHFYDNKTGKVVIYGYGTYTEGWCDQRSVGSGHGPVLINKCAMGAVADFYKDRGWLTRGATEGHKSVDALCLYSGWMSRVGKHIGYMQGPPDSFGNLFFQECHGCSIASLQYMHVTFVNVQGNGYTDEYPKNPAAAAAFETWLDKTFPIPSRFEIKT